MAQAPVDDEANINYLWEEYEARLKAEKEYREQGIDIYPSAGFVVKTWLHPHATNPVHATSAAVNAAEFDETAIVAAELPPTDTNGMKLFVNMTSEPSIGAPGEEETPDGEMQYRIPLSAGPLRGDVDKYGQECIVCDVVFSPETVMKAQKDREFRNLVAQFAIQNLEVKHKTQCVPRIKFPNLKYKATAQASKPLPQRIRKSAAQKKQKIELMEDDDTDVTRDMRTTNDEAIAREKRIREAEKKKKTGTMSTSSSSSSSSGKNGTLHAPGELIIDEKNEDLATSDSSSLEAAHHPPLGYVAPMYKTRCHVYQGDYVSGSAPPMLTVLSPLQNGPDAAVVSLLRREKEESDSAVDVREKEKENEVHHNDNDGVDNDGDDGLTTFDRGQLCEAVSVESWYARSDLRHNNRDGLLSTSASGISDKSCGNITESKGVGGVPASFSVSIELPLVPRVNEVRVEQASESVLELQSVAAEDQLRARRKRRARRLRRKAGNDVEHGAATANHDGNDEDEAALGETHAYYLRLPLPFACASRADGMRAVFDHKRRTLMLIFRTPRSLFTNDEEDGDAEGTAAVSKKMDSMKTGGQVVSAVSVDWKAKLSFENTLMYELCV